MNRTEVYRVFGYTRARIRGLAVTWFIRLMGGSVGNTLLVERGVRFRHAPTKHWHFGSCVYLGYNLVLDVEPGSSLRIGNRVKLMHGTTLGVSMALEIGHQTQVGEYTSVRDSNHTIDTTRFIRDSPLNSAPVSIGEDVWLGRGCVVTAGCVIGDGSVLGANSVVTRSLPPRIVAAGSPAKVLRKRRQS